MKSNEVSHDLVPFIGKKIELSLKNSEPIIGVLATCSDSAIELLICGHSFMILRNDILNVRDIKNEKKKIGKGEPW